MRIAVNTRLLLENRLEGIGWFTYETLKRIATNHPEHEFFFLFDRPYASTFIFAKNVTPIVIAPQSRHPFLWYIWFEYSVYKTLKKINADVFVSPDGYLSLSSNIPSVSVIHDINFEHYPEQFRWLVRKYLLHYFPLFAKKATRIVTVSEYSKQDISQTYNLDPSKIDVAYNGANPVYRPLSLKEKNDAKKTFANGTEYFIYIGALLPRKNIARMLQAFDAFKETTRSNIKMVIVGAKMFNTKDIEKTYKEMKYKSDVVFTGRLAPGEIEIAMGGALALTYVSYFEGFGIPLIEAMYANVPVITSNATSLPEVAGNAALITDPFSVNSIKEAMIKIYSDENLRNDLINKGREHCKKYSWDNTAKQLWDSIIKATNPNQNINELSK
jgi:glycosyltransferase involved in cell wall biosynthesis